MNRSCSAIAATTLTFVSSMAVAQTTTQDIERAAEYYSQAIERFRAADFEAAADLFRSSYDLVPQAELLYNEAVARARAGDRSAARRVSAEALQLKELPERVQTKFDGRLVGWSTVDLATAVAGEATAVAIAPPEPDAGPVDVISESPPPRSGNPLRIASVVVGGLGLGALATWGVMELRLQQFDTRIEQAIAERQEEAFSVLLDRARSHQRVGRVSLVSGGVLIAASLVLWVISGPEEPPQTVMIRF